MNASTMQAPWMQFLKKLIPASVVGLLGLMILPLPAFVLDLLISLNISLSMVILLTAVYVRTPVEFSVFPSTLLLVTVFRLGLNIASTRRILLHGPEGMGAAGKVIEAFGQFVVGGNMVVGLVIFLALIAVQFIVINHGANRISEVAARFTLDAMPGKQMAIDADLNAGLIDETHARERREKIQEEADFYGAMDGAVKFTQRDAIASILIVIINIIAGLSIGILQAGMAPLEAIRTFTVLTVGDGLVSAIPALLVSVSGAFVTTRSAGDDELAVDLISQFSNPRALGVAGGALALLGLVPGLPTAAFLMLASVLGGAAYALSGEPDAAPEIEAETAVSPAPDEPIEPLLVIDPLTIEVGYDLVEAAGSDRPGGLLDRIRGIRRQLALDLGIVVPPVRVRDNLKLAADEYQILLRGAEVGRARLPHGRVLAIDPGDAFETIEGERTRDPAFGIPALWIDEAQADHARSVGYTVVDRTSVIATHLSELIQKHAPELLGRQETQKLLEMLGKTAAKLVEELVPERFTVGQVQKVLQALLRERVSVRDLETICEAMADCAGNELTQDQLVGHVRRALSRTLVRPFVNESTLDVLTLTPAFEKQVRNLLAPGPQGTPLPADPRVMQKMTQQVAQAMRKSAGRGQAVVLCGSPEARAALRRITQGALPTVPFLAAHEIPDGLRINAVGQVG